MFIRVRSVRPGDPLHEFDIPVWVLERHPDRYEAVDPEPVAKSRPALIVPGVVPGRELRDAAKPKRKRSVTKTGENDASLVGPTEEETDD